MHAAKAQPSLKTKIDPHAIASAPVSGTLSHESRDGTLGCPVNFDDSVGRAQEDLLQAAINPRNKSNFTKTLVSQETSQESSKQLRGANKIRANRAALEGMGSLPGERASSSCLKARRNKKNMTAAQQQGKVTGRWTEEEH